MTDEPTLAPGEFFLATEYTTRETAYQAPEQVLEFRARMIDTTPQGERIAFGYARWENTDWSPTGYGEADWRRYNWRPKNQEGDSHG